MKPLILIILLVLGLFGCQYPGNDKFEKEEPVEQTPDKNNSEQISYLSSYWINRLQEKGLQNPVENIKRDLMQHSELIPFEGVLGGTMGFYSEENIYILSEKWVYARFDDGHIDGHIFLEYEISDEGEINWTVIKSYLTSADL